MRQCGVRLQGVLDSGEFKVWPPRSSVADPESFNVDPDPTVHADVDPAPDPDPKHFSQKEK